MRQGVGFSVASVFSLAIVFACSGNSDLSSFTQGYCGIIGDCCTQAGLPNNSSQCESLLSSACTGYDNNAGQQCLNDLRAAKSADPNFCTSMSGTSPPSCNKVCSKNAGSTPPGGACMKDSDCAAQSDGKATCVYAGNANMQTRTCVDVVDGKAGDTPCIGVKMGSITEYTWNLNKPYPTRGFVCDVAQGVRCDSTSMACTALKNPGDPCTQDSDCVTTAYCDFSMSKCAARVTDGGSCKSASCVASDYCDSPSMTCMARAAAGAQCTTSQQCQSSSCTNGKCDKQQDLGLALLCALL